MGSLIPLGEDPSRSGPDLHLRPSGDLGFHCMLRHVPRNILLLVTWSHIHILNDDDYLKGWKPIPILNELGGGLSSPRKLFVNMITSDQCVMF